MLKPVSRRVLIRKLKKLGFYGPYAGGRHQFMERDDFRLIIPNVHGDDIGIKLLKLILKQAEIPESDFLKI